MPRQRQTKQTDNTTDQRRTALLAHVLDLSGGALLYPVGPTGRLIANFHEQTTYKKIRHGEFELPCVKMGRHLFCRVHDIVSLLLGSEIDSLQAVAPVPSPGAQPGRGRPRKYSDSGSASRENVKIARAAKVLKREAARAVP